MDRSPDPPRSCADDVCAAYREGREAGHVPHFAYMAALHTFERRHPESGIFEAMGAVKDALADIRELGLVDCA